MADRRDAPTWVAVELTSAGEHLIEDGLLEDQLRLDLGVDDDFGIFLPSVRFLRNGNQTTYHLMEGYVFIETGLDEVVYFALEEQPYVSQVLSTKGIQGSLRTLHAVSNTQIEAMRLQLRGMATSHIPIGSKVVVMDGQYRNLEGKIVGVEGDDAHVRITLRSLDIVATIPRIFLEEIPEGDAQ